MWLAKAHCAERGYKGQKELQPCWSIWTWAGGTAGIEEKLVTDSSLLHLLWAQRGWNSPLSISAPLWLWPWTWHGLLEAPDGIQTLKALPPSPGTAARAAWCLGNLCICSISGENNCFSSPENVNGSKRLSHQSPFFCSHTVLLKLKHHNGITRLKKPTTFPFRKTKFMPSNPSNILNPSKRINFIIWRILPHDTGWF